MDRPRTILRLTGADTDQFLQGLVTNDIGGLSNGLVYAALLTPQGKYIADFFLFGVGMYKLRADVAISPTDLHLHRGLGAGPPDGHADPRASALGWRAYRDKPQTGDKTDWTALRVAHGIPAAGIELTEDSYILENRFEHLNGVDFRKGCYVGQEVTARMKHKTDLRKGLVRVTIDGAAPVGTPITREGRAVGTLYSQAGNQALAYLRLDRAGEDMIAGDARIAYAP